MEVLLHHHAFSKPTWRRRRTPRQKPAHVADDEREIREMYDVATCSPTLLGK